MRLRISCVLAACAVLVLQSQGRAAASLAGAWAIAFSPNPQIQLTRSPPENILSGITCASASDCWAIGSYSPSDGVTQPLIEHWNGVLWSVVSSPSPGGVISSSSDLYATTCTAASDCWAVGSYVPAATAQTLIQHWDGTSWSIVPSPNSSPADHNQLFGVACVSASDCWAVGQIVIPPYPPYIWLPLFEHWDGVLWSLVASPKAIAGTASSLQSVACVGPDACWAVGTSDFQSLIERWDGTLWSIVSSPSPSADTYLFGVTCASASDCWAAGYYIDAQLKAHTLALHWDGLSWSLAFSPDVEGSSNSEFSGVTCGSASDCWAVGRYYPGDGTLVEHWDGAEWAIVSSPNVGTAYNELRSVACTLQSDCWAVGLYTEFGPGVGRTLAMHYAPEPSGLEFFSVAPCRVLDTRQQGGALVSGVARSLSIAGACGVPATAKAVSFNLTAASPTGAGSVAFYPDAGAPPIQGTTGTISFGVNQTRANNQVLGLAGGGDGTLQVQSNIPGGGSVHVVVDVNGYFQ